MKRSSRYDHAFVNWLTLVGRQIYILLNHVNLLLQKLTIFSSNSLYNNRVSRLLLVIILIIVASLITWRVHQNVTSKYLSGPLTCAVMKIAI